MRDFRLMAAPAYRGFVARKYGGRCIIPRQSQMYWLMEGRRFVKWLQWQNDANEWRDRRRLHTDLGQTVGRTE